MLVDAVPGLLSVPLMVRVKTQLSTVLHLLEAGRRWVAEAEDTLDQVWQVPLVRAKGGDGWQRRKIPCTKYGKCR